MPYPPLRLTIMTPAESLLAVSEVQWVQVPLSDGGSIGIWPGHGPLLAETAPGTLRYADEQGEHTESVGAGVLQISSDEVVILTPGSAEETREIKRDGRLLRDLLCAAHTPPTSGGP